MAYDMANRIFRYVDDWASVRLVDSFVKENKAGTGNGEASLYLGSKYDPDIFSFFGSEAFDAHCIMMRDEILEYLLSVKQEYIHHRFSYRNEVSLHTWEVLYNEVKMLPEELNFNLTRKRLNDKTGRVYAQEVTYKRSSNIDVTKAPKAYTYNLIRRVAIPEVTFLMLSKMSEDGSEMYAKLYYDSENS